MLHKHNLLLSYVMRELNGIPEFADLVAECERVTDKQLDEQKQDTQADPVLLFVPKSPAQEQTLASGEIPARLRELAEMPARHSCPSCGGTLNKDEAGNCNICGWPAQ